MYLTYYIVHVSEKHVVAGPFFQESDAYDHPDYNSYEMDILHVPLVGTVE